MRWTQEQLVEYMARVHPEKVALNEPEDTPDSGPESKLQRKCLEFCEEKGWPCWHDWSRKRNVPGWPDLIIFKPNEVVLVELKAGSGKLRPEQETLRRQMMWLGHRIYLVRSFSRFLEVVK